jgi:tetratricopeptide (TPR) repeat protein
LRIRISKRAACAALLLLALGTGSATPAHAAPAGVDGRAVQTLQAIDAAIKANDCPKVVKLGEPLLKRQGGKLSAELEAALDTIVAGCAFEAGAKDKAYAFALQGTRLDESPDELWRLRLSIELDTKKLAAAVATVEAMSQGRGAALDGAPMQWLFELDRDLKEAGLKSERKRLLRILTADAYAPTETLGDAQAFRYTYAKLLAEEGDGAGARAMLATITSPYLLTDVLFEPRLAALFPAGLDLRAATEAALAKDRALAERYPDRLGPIVGAAGDLRLLGRSQEALDLLQPALARAADKEAFADAEDKLPWAWDGAARANTQLGRYEEAAKAFAAGAALGESGMLNVSQVINLAHLQVRFGHPRDALKTLAVFDDPKRQASPFGDMEMRLARGCAHAAAGNAQAAAADLAYAEAHAKDHPAALGYLYLCLDRIDQAAAFFIQRLDDPDKRGEILRDFSDYDPPPRPVPAQFGGKVEAVKARADVKAAIARAGGLRRIPLQAYEM